MLLGSVLQNAEHLSQDEKKSARKTNQSDRNLIIEHFTEAHAAEDM
jgi:hypothetical protein